MKKVNKLSGDDEMVRLYTKLSRREMEFNTYKNEAREEGRAEGIAEGIAEGRIEESKNIALKMINENISMSMISKCTGLSLEEIKNLK